MRTRTKKIISIAITCILMLAFASAPLISHAQSAQSPSVCVSGAETLPCRIQQLFNIGIGVIGFIALVGVIYGGFQYMTSHGNAEKSGRAKTTIISSVIGLVLAILSVSLLNLFSPQFTQFSADWFIDQDSIGAGPYKTFEECKHWTCGYVKKSDGQYYCIGPQTNSCDITLTGLDDILECAKTGESYETNVCDENGKNCKERNCCDDEALRVEETRTCEVVQSKSEGEICTSKAQCRSGLECVSYDISPHDIDGTEKRCEKAGSIGHPENGGEIPTAQACLTAPEYKQCYSGLKCVNSVDLSIHNDWWDVRYFLKGTEILAKICEAPASSN